MIEARLVVALESPPETLSRDSLLWQLPREGEPPNWVRRFNPGPN